MFAVYVHPFFSLVKKEIGRRTSPPEQASEMEGFVSKQGAAHMRLQKGRNGKLIQPRMVGRFWNENRVPQKIFLAEILKALWRQMY